MKKHFEINNKVKQNMKGANTMKKFSKMRYTLLGMLIMAILCATVIPALAAQSSKQLDAYYNDIKIVIDRNQITPKDVNGQIVEPFIVDGTTYLPVRALCEAIGYGVQWDGGTNTVTVYTKSEPVTGDEVGQAFAKVYLSDGTLQDYTINSVTAEAVNTWLVNYSVLPKAGQNGWMAGNGETGQNGWVVNKTMYVYAVKTDGVVNLTVLGTGL